MLNVISGFILGTVIAVIVMQYLEANVHPMAYWLVPSGAVYITLGECMEYETECKRQVGWFIE